MIHFIGGRLFFFFFLFVSQSFKIGFDFTLPLSFLGNGRMDPLFFFSLASIFDITLVLITILVDANSLFLFFLLLFCVMFQDVLIVL